MTPVLAQLPRADRSFERLYKRHVRDVYRYALVVLRSPEDAEDVTQTTFLNAYRAYSRGERPRAAQNWLIAIAHNVCRQRFRQASRRPQEVEFDDAADRAVPDDDTPSADDILRALGHLAFNQRAALVMREIEGRSYQQIAEILGVSTGAVETLVFRARRALRELLEGSLTCHEAERAVSRQLDGQLPRSERPALRGHLRECEDCAHFARSQRAQQKALRAYAMVPLPASLASFFGGTAAGGSALAVKGAVVFATGLLAAGIGYEGLKQVRSTSPDPTPPAGAAGFAPIANRTPVKSSAAAKPSRRAVAPKATRSQATSRSAARIKPTPTIVRKPVRTVPARPTQKTWGRATNPPPPPIEPTAPPDHPSPADKLHPPRPPIPALKPTPAP